MKTMNAAWRLEKCELKIKYFDGRTHNNALAQRSHIAHIPDDMWRNLVEFWESPKGQVSIVYTLYFILVVLILQ